MVYIYIYKERERETERDREIEIERDRERKMLHVGQCNNELVKMVWDAKASSRYRDMISEIKRKGKKPNFIDPDLWERWRRYWNILEAKNIHET